MNEKDISSLARIDIRPNRASQPRAYIAGTRVRVRDIYVQAELRGLSPDEIIVALPHLTLGQVHAALSWYFDNRGAILEEIRQDDEFVATMKAVVEPGPVEKKRRAANADSLPS